MTVSAQITRRNLFSILPAGAAGCLACQAAAQGWTEQAGMTWEEIFRFAFQRNFIRSCSSEAARKGMQSKQIPNRDLASWVAGLKFPPPLMQHALEFEIVEDSPKAFEFGYAAICYPDYAVATGFNPKVKLIRTKTLMQGHECCNHRYVIEG